MLEELNGLFYCHVEHISNIFAFVIYFQCLAVIALAPAYLAFHFNIGQEIHFYNPGSSAFTVLAPAAFYIEGETPGFVSPDFRFRYQRKQVADFRKNIDIGGGVGTRCSANGRLIDFNDFVNMFQTGKIYIGQCTGSASVIMPLHNRVERAVDEARLATTGHACYTYQCSQW